MGGEDSSRHRLDQETTRYHGRSDGVESPQTPANFHFKYYTVLQLCVMEMKYQAYKYDQTRIFR